MNRILVSLSAALLLCAGLLWWQLGNKTEKLGNITAQLETSQTKAESLSNTLRLQRELITDAEVFDRTTTQGLTDAQAGNDLLQRDVAGGNKRLLIKAECPAARVPDAAGTASLDDAAAAELSADSRPDYHALREQLTTTEHALAGLQEWVGAFCQ